MCRSASILCCGKESLRIELRVRTICELVLNEAFYLQPSITSLFAAETAGKNALVATSASFEKACANEGTDIARMVFRLDCIATTKLDEWSNMWHVYGLASVLNTPITSIYPQVNSRVRQLFHREVHPRICDVGLQSSIPLVIMWTHLSSIPKQCVDTHWSPNNFVPCFASTTLTITTPLIASREKDGNTPSSKSQTTLTDSHSVLTDVGQAAISSPRVSLPMCRHSLVAK